MAPSAALAALLLAFAQAVAPPPPVTAPPPTPQMPASPTQAEGGLIREVRFEGDTRLTSEALRLQVRTKEGGLYSERIADEDLKMLGVRFHIWGDTVVQQLPDGALRVIFHLDQVPSVGRVQFHGNSELDEDDLRAALGLSENNALPSSTVLGPGLELLRRRLHDKYEEEGFLYCEIEPRTEKQGDELVLVFEILEGPEVRVDSVEFTGLEEFAPRHLRSLMKTSRSFWFFKETYKPDVLRDDVFQIEQFLRDEGYLDARVAVESVTPDLEGAEVDILIRIDQGPRYRVHAIKFEGNTKFAPEELQALVKLAPGMVYRQAIYRKDRTRLLDHYRHVGFVRAEINQRPVEAYVSGKPEVDVTYKITEDESKRVRAVRVVGNTNTKDAVVRRELDLHPGELFDGDEMASAEDRLRASGFFSDERGTPIAFVENEKTDDPRYEDVVMRVEDGTAGVFSLFGGIASGTGVFLGTDLTIDNFDLTALPSSPFSLFDEFLDQKAFHGGGQRLRLSANPGNRYSNYVLQFTEPYLTGPLQRPVFLDFNFHLREFASRFYDQSTLGATVSIGKRFSRQQSVTLGLRQDRITIEHIQDRVDPIEDLLAVEGANTVRALVAGWDWRDLDSLRNPTAGWTANLTGEWLGGPLGAEVDAWKASAASEWLLPLFENDEEQVHVLSVAGAASYAAAYGSSDHVPLFERYFAGGPSTFLEARGFQYRGLGPHDDNFSIGGTAGWVINTEYVFPLVSTYDARLRENQPFLRGLVFYDTGMLERDFGDLRDARLRMSVGVGLRLKIPFQLFSAPLEFFYGIPLQKGREDERESFQINFSTRF